MTTENATTVAETPSETIAGTRTKVLVTDARGRVIAVRKLTALNYFHLTKVMGDSAGNTMLMDLAITAAAVCRVNTTDLAFPRKEEDVEFVMQLLDFDGIKAAGDGLRQLSTKMEDEAEAAKNSAGDPTLS
ncbi:MAG: hypothetical protein ACRECA_07890 [Pseudolabrys sp.]